jgi:hypothetical protein
MLRFWTSAIESPDFLLSSSLNARRKRRKRPVNHARAPALDNKCGGTIDVVVAPRVRRLSQRRDNHFICLDSGAQGRMILTRQRASMQLWL